MKKILLVLVVLGTILYGQVEHSGGANNPYAVAPKFYLDLAGYPSEIQGKTRVDVFLKMPYSSIQFVRDNDKFKGAYSVNITFYDEDGEKILFERMWNEQILVNSFEATNSPTSFNISYRSSDLVPGEYALKCTVEDKDSKKSFEYTGELNIKSYDLEVSLSDIIFIEKTVSDANGERIIPSVNNTFSNRDESIYFFYEVHADTSQDLKVRYTVVDEEDDEHFRFEKMYSVNSGANFIKHLVKLNEISLGDFRLKISILDEDDDETISTSKIFKNKLYGFPSSISNINDAIDQMLYIASSDDIEYIKEAEQEKLKLDRYIDYWTQKDPSPNTVENEVLIEYYRRVAYSNEHFKSFYAGWKTDMGMIYITLGAPDQVDRHPMDYNSKPYEVWDYYDINRRFVFVDQTGFGDYRLLNPVYGDWYRYRN